MQAIATKQNLPCELIAYIYDFINMKLEYNQVLNELLLLYNSGLWWLCTLPQHTIDEEELALALADPQNKHLHYLDGASIRMGVMRWTINNSRLFTTYNNDNYTCTLAILKAEVLYELYEIYYYSYGYWWFDNMLDTIRSLDIFHQHKYNYMIWQTYLFDSKISQKKYFYKTLMPFYTIFEQTIRDHNAFLL